MPKPVELLTKFADKKLVYYSVITLLYAWHVWDMKDLECPYVLLFVVEVLIASGFLLLVTIERKNHYAKNPDFKRDGFPFGGEKDSLTSSDGKPMYWLADRNMIKCGVFFILFAILCPYYFASEEDYEFALKEPLMQDPIYLYDGSLLEPGSSLILHLPCMFFFGFALTDFYAKDTRPDFKYQVHHLVSMMLVMMAAFGAWPRIASMIVCLSEFGSFVHAHYVATGKSIPFLVIFPLSNLVCIYLTYASYQGHMDPIYGEGGDWTHKFTMPWLPLGVLSIGLHLARFVELALVCKNHIFKKGE